MKASSRYTQILRPLSVLFLFAFITGCSDYNSSSNNNNDPAPVAPKVFSIAPASDAKDVAPNTKIVAYFDQEMDPATLDTSFTVQGVDDGPAINGAVTYDATSKAAIFAPNSPLGKDTTYEAAVSTDARNVSGQSLASDFLWSFTTGSTDDTIAPTVKSNKPADGAGEVAINNAISVSFSEDIDPSTVKSSTFTLLNDNDGTAVTGTVSALGTTVTFDPETNLQANTPYTATLTDGIKDLSGNALANDVQFSFTTGSNPSAGPDPVNLGGAGDFVILAKTAVSTTGSTDITGDLGLSPEARTAYTGFSEMLSSDGTFATSALVTGKLFAANMTSPTPVTLTTAVSNMETAYTDAAGRPDPDESDLGNGEIGGRTIEPGLYKWGSSVNISNDVTLKGDSNDVWIFQVSGELIAATGVSVTLSGGALPENIFWQVADNVKLRANSAFKGIILGKTQIVLETGATLNGRALAQTQVTLDGNTVKPTQ